MRPASSSSPVCGICTSTSADSTGGMRAGPALIAHGVTGVRDMASPLDEILTLRNRWQTASAAGPIGWWPAWRHSLVCSRWC